ncbi:MAG TPA: hypothetical protein VHN79_13650 [Lacunisphaera sp.]|nr:hypothetical protein [Lacunisphaera sp.]
MSSHSSSRSATVARAQASTSSLSLSAALGDQLSTLYELAQRSAHVFGTPLGPFAHAGRHHYLPRFVYFGPHTSEESPRLAFLAGLDSRDLRPTLALLHLIEELALAPDIGQSLHLAFYPLVDVLGHLQQAGARDLAADRWLAPSTPEIDLLAKDSRLLSFHAFIRIESARADDIMTLSLRAAGGAAASIPLISSQDTDPFPVRWEIQSDLSPDIGPSSLGEDLPFRPLDLTLRVPASWSPGLYREAVAAILKRFIVRYRGLLAYGQHL